VWAYPNFGSKAPAVFLGAADYGSERPDVEAAFGGRARRSGFCLTVRGLAECNYLLAVYGRSTVTGSFNQVRTTSIVVAPRPLGVIDTPQPGVLTSPAHIAGWVLDAAADGGTGIEAVHVWAYPVAGGTPLWIGAATSWIPRADVAAAYGNPAFVASGYFIPFPPLPPGSYRVVVYARRVAASSFDHVAFVDVSVSAEPASRR
jgi:hypothetical protein